MEDKVFDIKYCKKCLLPNTRPGVFIGDDGISNVWKESHTVTNNIDWNKRKKQFEILINQIKKSKKRI